MKGTSNTLNQKSFPRCKNLNFIKTISSEKKSNLSSTQIFANKQRFCLSVKYGCLSIINGDSSEKSQSLVN